MSGKGSFRWTSRHQSIAEVAAGISRSLVNNRLLRGWSTDEALGVAPRQRLRPSRVRLAETCGASADTETDCAA
jgi:hypothetical protein